MPFVQTYLCVAIPISWLCANVNKYRIHWRSRLLTVPLVIRSKEVTLLLEVQSGVLEMKTDSL